MVCDSSSQQRIMCGPYTFQLMKCHTRNGAGTQLCVAFGTAAISQTLPPFYGRLFQSAMFCNTNQSSGNMRDNCTHPVSFSPSSQPTLLPVLWCKGSSNTMAIMVAPGAFVQANDPRFNNLTKIKHLLKLFFDIMSFRNAQKCCTPRMPWATRRGQTPLCAATSLYWTG